DSRIVKPDSRFAELLFDFRARRGEAFGGGIGHFLQQILGMVDDALQVLYKRVLAAFDASMGNGQFSVHDGSCANKWVTYLDCVQARPMAKSGVSCHRESG